MISFERTPLYFNFHVKSHGQKWYKQHEWRKIHKIVHLTYITIKVVYLIRHATKSNHRWKQRHHRFTSAIIGSSLLQSRRHVPYTPESGATFADKVFLVSTPHASQLHPASCARGEKTARMRMERRRKKKRKKRRRAIYEWENHYPSVAQPRLLLNT